MHPVLALLCYLYISTHSNTTGKFISGIMLVLMSRRQQEAALICTLPAFTLVLETSLCKIPFQLEQAGYMQDRTNAGVVKYALTVITFA